MKILIVDDDAFALKIMTRRLAHVGQQDVTTYAGARPALDAVRSAMPSFDLVFCDLQMPDMDGVEFVRHLAELRFGGALVLVSGTHVRVLQTVERLARGHGLRVLGALAKPVPPAELARVLERVAAVVSSSGLRAEEPCSAADLGEALRTGALCNHYQPQVDVASGAVLAVEALVRWPRAGGMIFPDRFVPTAERHGLIDQLTSGVLRRALHQARMWRDAGLDLRVSVNVSMANLVALDFPDIVAAEAAAHGVPPANLLLEVTESRLMADPLAPLDIVTRLRLKRIGLAIDDFGTGHSSLAQLRDLPFDELKIDRGFIHGAHSDRSLRAIVEASVAMARQMGMRTVAEGVEDVDDWQFVREAGCDCAQGWFIARPMAPEQVMGWAQEWHERFDAMSAAPSTVPAALGDPQPTMWSRRR